MRLLFLLSSEAFRTRFSVDLLTEGSFDDIEEPGKNVKTRCPINIHVEDPWDTEDPSSEKKKKRTINVEDGIERKKYALLLERMKSILIKMLKQR